MEDEEMEYTLLTLREAMVHQVPPASTSKGHKAEDWKECIWKGRCRICGKGKDLYIKMIDAATGQLFAQCTIPGGEHDKYVERVTDSSRYFVLKITNGARHAFIGMGFEERNDAFDFNCALADFKTTWVDRDKVPEEAPEHQPSKDLSLKSGQKIQIKLKGMGDKRRNDSGSQARQGGGGEIGFGVVAPPPAAGGQSRRQQVVPAPAAVPSVSVAKSPPPEAQDDFFGDFDDFQSAGAAPAQATTGVTPSLVVAAPSPSPPQRSQDAAADNLTAQLGSLSIGCGPIAPAAPPKDVVQLPMQTAPHMQPAPPMQTAPTFDPFAGFTGFGGSAPTPSPAASVVASTSTSGSTAKRDPFDEFDIFK